MYREVFKLVKLAVKELEANKNFNTFVWPKNFKGLKTKIRVVFYSESSQSVYNDKKKNWLGVHRSVGEYSCIELFDCTSQPLRDVYGVLVHELTHEKQRACGEHWRGTTQDAQLKKLKSVVGRHAVRRVRGVMIRKLLEKMYWHDPLEVEARLAGGQIYGYETSWCDADISREFELLYLEDQRLKKAARAEKRRAKNLVKNEKSGKPVVSARTSCSSNKRCIEIRFNAMEYVSCGEHTNHVQFYKGIADSKRVENTTQNYNKYAWKNVFKPPSMSFQDVRHPGGPLQPINKGG